MPKEVQLLYRTYPEGATFLYKLTKLSSMPRNVMVVDGPVVFCGSRGSPAMAQVSPIIMFFVHVFI